jgi:dethiobiotin synthetase
MPHLQANLDTLREELQRRHQAPCLGVVPRLADAHPSATEAYLHSAALHRLLAP